MFVILYVILTCLLFLVFFFNDTATTEIYTLSLHDALPISDFREPYAAGICAWCGPRESGRVPVFLTETLPSGVSWHQQVQLAGVPGLLSILEELASTERVRAGGDDLASSIRPLRCRQSQKGRFRQMLRPLRPATNPDKLSGAIMVGWDAAISAPTAIPAAAPGASCSASPATHISRRLMARRCMASASHPIYSCGRWPPWPKAWAFGPWPGSLRLIPTRCCSGWSKRRTIWIPLRVISSTTCTSVRCNCTNSLPWSVR